MSLFHNLPEQRRPFAPVNRPAMKADKPHAMPRTVEIEIRDNARLLCRKDRDGYVEGARPKRNGGTPSGATSPGFNALMGWGDKAPVNGMMQAAVAYDTAPKRKLRIIRGA